MTSQIRAIVVDRLQSPDTLHVSTIPAPSLADDSVLVDIKAAGCNFFDILLAQGKYQIKPQLPFVLGSEFAGVVLRVGSKVDSFHVGDRVYGFLPYGAFAEQVCVHQLQVKKIPSESMSFAEATAFGTVYPTSYQGLVGRANLRCGETLLITAAAGGVGLAAVQIGKALGAKVIAAAGSDDKLNVCKQYGADHVINYSTEDILEKVKQFTDGKGVDVIYDPVGGDLFKKLVSCLAFSGRIIVVGFASGKIPSVETNRILLKNISVVGLHWGAYAIHDPDEMKKMTDGCLNLYKSGFIKPVVFRQYPIEQVSEALKELANRKTHGKVVLTFDRSAKM